MEEKSLYGWKHRFERLKNVEKFCERKEEGTQNTKVARSENAFALYFILSICHNKISIPRVIVTKNSESNSLTL